MRLCLGRAWTACWKETHQWALLWTGAHVAPMFVDRISVPAFPDLRFLGASCVRQTFGLSASLCFLSVSWDHSQVAVSSSSINSSSISGVCWACALALFAPSTHSLRELDGMTGVHACISFCSFGGHGWESVVRCCVLSFVRSAGYLFLRSNVFRLNVFHVTADWFISVLSRPYHYCDANEFVRNRRRTSYDMGILFRGATYILLSGDTLSFVFLRLSVRSVCWSRRWHSWSNDDINPERKGEKCAFLQVRLNPCTKRKEKHIYLLSQNKSFEVVFSWCSSAPCVFFCAVRLFGRLTIFCNRPRLLLRCTIGIHSPLWNVQLWQTVRVGKGVVETSAALCWYCYLSSEQCLLVERSARAATENDDTVLDLLALRRFVVVAKYVFGDQSTWYKCMLACFVIYPLVLCWM